MISPSPYGPTFANEHATLVLDRRGVIRLSNAAASRMFGASAGELAGRPVSTLISDLPLDGKAPEDRSDFWLSEGTWRQFQGLGLNGRAFPVEASQDQLELDGTPFFLLRLRFAAAPREEMDHLRRLQSAVEQSADAVYITNWEGVIEYVNPAFESMTGFSRAEAVGKTPALLKSDTPSPEPYASMWATLKAGKEFSGVFVNRRKNGDLYHEKKLIRPFIDSLGRITHFVATGRDVSEQIRAIERLQHLAHHDPLTGLPNRGLFLDRLHREFIHASRHGGGFALLYLDLDLFKPVNDLYGHAVGDQLLQAVAATLTQCVREEDTVARLGGDEFGLILMEVSRRRYARNILEAIVGALRCGAVIDGERLPISASIGACMYPDDGTDEHLLLKRADSAMYRAKSAGGNGYCFFDPDREGQRSASSAPATVGDTEQRDKPPKRLFRPALPGAEFLADARFQRVESV